MNNAFRPLRGPRLDRRVSESTRPGVPLARKAAPTGCPWVETLERRQLFEASPFSSSGPFFDYGLPNTGKLGQPGFAPAPFLDNTAASVASVSTLLQSRQNAGLTLSVKV